MHAADDNHSAARVFFAAGPDVAGAAADAGSGGEAPDGHRDPAGSDPSGRGPLEYRYVIVACCFAFTFVNVGVASTAFALFQPYINALPGMSDTLGSIVVATRMLVAFAVTFATARYYELLDCRLGATLACLSSAAGFVVMGVADGSSAAFALLCLGSVLCGFGYGVGGGVASTLLIGRWYEGRTGTGTAIGAASMGSGLATIVMPLAVVPIIEGVSLRAGFFVGAGASLVLAVVVYAFLRNRPPERAGELAAGGEVGRRAVGCDDRRAAGGDDRRAEGASEGAAGGGAARGRGSKPSMVFWTTLTASQFRTILAALFLLGVSGVGPNAYLSVLFTTSGFDAHFASVLLSVGGASLLVGKFLAGRAIDELGSRRGTTVFYGLLAAGLVMDCLAPFGSGVLAVVGVVVTYLGLALSSIGVSVWALEFATREGRARTVRNFQVALMAGTFVCNLFPGALMDLTGTYVVSYAIFLLAVVVSFVLVSRVYRSRAAA